MPVAPGPNPAGSETRVLLIEDNPGDRLLIEQYLLELPYAIYLDSVESIAEGRLKVEQDDFDCILLDHYLPDGDSLTLLKEMGDMHNDPAVIVMSTTDNRELQQQLLMAGASDFINKTYLNKNMLGRAISYAQARQSFIHKIYKQEEENYRLLGALRDTNSHLDELVELRTAQFKIAQQVAKEKAKQAEQASKVKSEFLATMSHEIRTPLNGVIGMLDLLRTTTLDDEQREFVNTAQTSAEILLALISDILDISRIEAGRFELEDSSFDLCETIEQVGRLLKPKAEAKGLFFSIEISPLLYPHVIGDATRLRQILVNLGDNAIKYTDHGDITIRVERILTPPEGKKLENNQCWVRFTISDSGIGIAEELQEKIFEPFTQVDGSFARRFGGTGLGLAIVQRLVEMLDGKISVHSVLGKGSSFTCELPFWKRAVQQSSDLHLSLNLAGVKVLIVDDDVQTCNSLHLWLQKWNAKIQIVKHGYQAIELLNATAGSEQSFNVMIAKNNMSDLAGSAMRSMIKNTKSMQHIHIITMMDGAEDNVEMYSDSVISKPIVAEELLMSFSHYLNRITEEKVQHTDVKINDEEDAKKQRHNKHILLVEDNPTNQLVATNILEKLGFATVDCVETGLEALELIKASDYDMIFMDCQLPEMDGYEVTRRIREWEKEHQLEHKPIIAMTANVMAGDRQRCIDAGMDDYIAKPVVVQSLDETLSRWENRETPCLKN